MPRAPDTTECGLHLTGSPGSGDTGIVTGHLSAVLLGVAVLVATCRVVVVRRGTRRSAGPSPDDGPVPSGWAVRLRYLVVGLVLGAAWSWNTGLPPWSHALRLGLLILVVPPLFLLARRTWASRRPGFDPTASSAHLRGWVVAKLVLVVAALALQVLLERWLSPTGAADVVGLVLVVTVASAGPLVHERLVTGWRRQAGARITVDG